jgi:hypothetical protein
MGGQLLTTGGIGSSEGGPAPPPTPSTRGFIGLQYHDRKKIQNAVDKWREKDRRKKRQRDLAILLMLSEF